MELKIQFDTGNAAFDDGDGPEECARILRTVAEKIIDGYTSGVAVDVNGNRVGRWSVDFRE